MPVLHQVEQGTDAWKALRCGIPTASNFKKIVTPTGKFSEQSKGYMYELIAEWLFQMPFEDIGAESLDQRESKTVWMTRGNDMEPQAVKAYEFEHDVKVQKVGFITNDLGNIGCSPDRLVGDDGLLEIKCPKVNTHLGYMLTGSIEQEYRPQHQGQLLIAQREWCDIQSYFPGLPTVIIRVNLDEAYRKILAPALEEFIQKLEQSKIDLIDRYGDFRSGAPKKLSSDPLEIGDEEVLIRQIMEKANG